MIFPFGGEGTASLVLPSQRWAARRSAEADIAPSPFARADGILAPPVPVCIDRSGVGRESHAWDKDSRCVFCDRRRISKKWRS